MRTTIACERCRRAKVKCKFEGHAPCRACIKTDNVSTCVLSGPVLRRSVGLPPKTSGVKRKESQAGPSEDPRTKKPRAEEAPDGIGELFRAVPREDFAKALAVFQAQFPEFGFIHPSDYDWAVDKLGSTQMLRLLAILAVASRYLTRAEAPSAEDCAALVTSELKRQVTSQSGIYLIQTYLIIALYDWGEGEGFNAWMYAGIASRMVQGSLVVRTPVNRARPLSELEQRTIWTCFAMDKLFSCGKQRPEMFKLHEMDIFLPLSDEDFAFDRVKDASSSKQWESLDRSTLTAGNHFQIILEGLSIWSQILGWLVEGGRRRPSMSESHNCPWKETSEWARMKSDLQTWRDRQEPQLKYPDTKVAVHVHLRRAEVFGYINLIYYTSLLFLCREFIPFLPVGETTPRGPIDPPFLTEIAPDGFWEHNRDNLWTAAAQMSDMMRDLRNAGTPIHTPFTGLCAFTSALMHLYAVSFPLFVGPEISTHAATRADASLQDLKKTSGIWKLGEEWLAVIETARNVFNRVTSSKPVSKSRYDYPELEDSMIMATLRGMPRPESEKRLRDEAAEAETEADEAADEDIHPSQRPAMEPSDPSAVLGSEYMGEDDWRLWSFWDDPHLLSTISWPEPDQGL